MNPGGLVLALAGVWVLCQVLGGNALVRLGVVESGDDSKSAPAPEFPNVPDKGFSNVPHDAQGRPL